MQTVHFCRADLFRALRVGDGLQNRLEHAALAVVRVLHLGGEQPQLDALRAANKRRGRRVALALGRVLFLALHLEPRALLVMPAM